MNSIQLTARSACNAAFKNIFQIKSVNSQTYTFCAASAEDKKTWIDALNKAFADMQPADKGARPP
jgi:hypothetical protein